MTEDFLQEGERLDDLERNGLKIIQSDEVFKFGMDAVLLSGFARAGGKERIVDLCSGNGILPLLLSAKTDAKRIFGVELQPYLADMAERSVRYNDLEDRITIINDDIKNCFNWIEKTSVDVVTCNPPYMKDGHGLVNESNAKTLARHEVALVLDDAVRVAAGLLRDKGAVFFVHRPFRLTELITAMHRHGVEAKRMRFVHPYSDKEPNMVLVEGAKGGRPYLNVERPLIVYKSPGVYTKEITDIYRF